MKSTVDKILKQYGTKILLEENRFAAIIGDLAFQTNEMECKVIQRMAQTHILRDLYNYVFSEDADSGSGTNIVVVRMKEEGFTEKWCRIALSVFDMNTNAIASVYLDSSAQASVLQKEASNTISSFSETKNAVSVDEKSPNPSVVSLLQRAYFQIEDSQWGLASEYFNRVLDIQVDNGSAYFGLVLVENQCKTKDELKKIILTNGIPETPYWRRANQFADSDLKQWFASIEIEIQKRAQLADRIVASFQAELNRADAPDLEAQLDVAKQTLRDMLYFFESFNGYKKELDSQIQRKRMAKERIDLLQSQRAKLGIFSGKEKKRIDEEISALEQTIQSIDSILPEAEKKLRGYRSQEQIQPEIRKAQVAVEELKVKIEHEKAATASLLSYTEAKQIYDNDSYIKELVLAKLPFFDLRLEINSGSKTVHFGRFMQSNVDSNKTPIEWIILKKTDTRVLVISKLGLVGMRFNETSCDITWQTSSCRKWLNDAFIQEAFTPKEQLLIPRVTISSERGKYGNAYPGRDTVDRVFLLSISEANSLFRSDKERVCVGSQYCSLQDISSGTVSWWLRATGGVQCAVASVWPSGSVEEYGWDCSCDSFVIRPAMWIDLSLATQCVVDAIDGEK